MVDTAVADAGLDAGSRRRPGRRWWFGGAAVVLVLAAGAITAVTISFRYLHATPLSTNGGGWTAPDNVRSRFVDAGPYTASLVRPRYGRAQTFELTLNNLAKVSQTVLGLVDGRTLADPRSTGEPETLRVSTTDVYRHRGPTRFTSAPVTIPPGGQYRLRLTTVTGDATLWRCSRSEYYQGLDLRVRVGAFTRTERLDFGNFILEVQAAPCS